MTHNERKKSVRFSSVATFEEIDHVADVNWDSVMKQSKNESPIRTRVCSKGGEKRRDPCSTSNGDCEDNGTIRQVSFDVLLRKRQKHRAIKSVLIAQATARDHVENQDEFDVERFIAFFAAKESQDAKALAASIGKEVETAVLRHEECPSSSGKQIEHNLV